MATENVDVRTGLFLIRIVQSCQRKGEGDPRILKQFVHGGNLCLQRAGVTYQETESLFFQN